MAEDKEVQEGKIFAVLAYLGILCLIPLLAKKDNKFAFHHAKQGLVLFIGWIAIGILSWTPLVLLSPLVALALSIISLIGIIQAIMGNYWKCPVVFDLAEKIKL